MKFTKTFSRFNNKDKTYFEIWMWESWDNENKFDLGSLINSLQTIPNDNATVSINKRSDTIEILVTLTRAETQSEKSKRLSKNSKSIDKKIAELEKLGYKLEKK